MFKSFPFLFGRQNLRSLLLPTELFDARCRRATGAHKYRPLVFSIETKRMHIVFDVYKDKEFGGEFPYGRI